MRVLLITYHFPPDAEVGGVRPLQMARHLPQFGIEPWVLTVDPRFAESPNAGLRPDGVPEDRILRTAVEKTLQNRVVSLWRALKGQRAARVAGETGTDATAGSATGSLGEWANEWLSFPDTRFGWYRPALRVAEDAIRRVGFDAIISTSPPRVAALIARTLARRHGLPWVMDVRDPWAGWYHSATSSIGDSGGLRFLHGRIFRSCVASADVIVHNTERLRQLTGRLVSGAEPKTRCIPNGCDPDWRARPAGTPVTFQIGHYGQIMGLRSPTAFLEGLRLWLDSARPDPARIRVRFAGAGFQEVIRHAQRLGLSQMLTLDPPVPRQQVPDLMAEDYVLLLVANAQPLQVPGKTYEYLAAGRRILALTDHDGATADLLSTQAGCVVAEGAEESRAALDRFFREYEEGLGAWVDRAAQVAEMQYPRRVERFAEVIREVTSPV